MSVGAVFFGASFFHRWHGHLLPFVFFLGIEGAHDTATIFLKPSKETPQFA
jgi:hypothetical protein